MGPIIAKKGENRGQPWNLGNPPSFSSYLRGHPDLEQFGRPDEEIDLDPRRCDLPCCRLDHLVLCGPRNAEEIAR